MSSGTVAAHTARGTSRVKRARVHRAGAPKLAAGGGAEGERTAASRDDLGGQLLNRHLGVALAANQICHGEGEAA